MGIDAGESFIDADGRVGDESFAKGFVGKGRGVVLADATKLRVLVEDLFETALVFDEAGKIFIRAELPCHIAGGPEALVSVGEGLLEGGLEGVNHAVDVEAAALGEVGPLGREDEAGVAEFAGDVDASGGEAGLHVGDHERAVEVDAADVAAELLPDDGRENCEMARGRALVDKALMAGNGTHMTGTV
jgi:hypothetical protein